MKRQDSILRAALTAALLMTAFGAFAQDAPAIPAEYSAVLTALGKKGDYKANVLKVNIPRSDLKVTVDGVAVPTPFGFGGWLAMTKGSGGMNVMMGDLVLQEDEINPVMAALLENGLEVTALHNHFLWEQPRIFYMHVHGHGTPAELTQKVKPALDLIGKFMAHGNASAPANTTRLTTHTAAKDGTDGPTHPIDTARIAQIVGHPGEQNGAVYKITIGRDDLKVKEMGATINARMGLNTWAAFFGSSDDAVIAGDVAMLADEITPVLKALQAHGLRIVAMHHHMTDTKPMLYFLHYWGKGPAVTLAEGFKAALEELGKGKERMAH